MAQSFSFGFNDEDIESDTEEIGPKKDQDMPVDFVGEEGVLLAPRLHTIAEFVGNIIVNLCSYFLSGILYLNMFS